MPFWRSSKSSREPQSQSADSPNLSKSSTKQIPDFLQWTQCGLTPHSDSDPPYKIAVDGFNAGLIAVVSLLKSQNQLEIAVLQPDQNGLLNSIEIPFHDIQQNPRFNSIIDVQFHRSHPDIEWPQLVVLLDTQLLVFAMVSSQGHFKFRWQRSFFPETAGETTSGSENGNAAIGSSCLLCPFGVGWILVGMHTGDILCFSSRGESGHRLDCMLDADISRELRTVRHVALNPQNCRQILVCYRRHLFVVDTSSQAIIGSLDTLFRKSNDSVDEVDDRLVYSRACWSWDGQTVWVWTSRGCHQWIPSNCKGGEMILDKDRPTFDKELLCLPAKLNNMYCAVKLKRQRPGKDSSKPETNGYKSKYKWIVCSFDGGLAEFQWTPIRVSMKSVDAGFGPEGECPFVSSSPLSSNPWTWMPFRSTDELVVQTFSALNALDSPTAMVEDSVESLDGLDTPRSAHRPNSASAGSVSATSSTELQMRWLIASGRSGLQLVQGHRRRNLCFHGSLSGITLFEDPNDILNSIDNLVLHDFTHPGNGNLDAAPMSGQMQTPIHRSKLLLWFCTDDSFDSWVVEPGKVTPWTSTHKMNLCPDDLQKRLHDVFVETMEAWSHGILITLSTKKMDRRWVAVLQWNDTVIEVMALIPIKHNHKVVVDGLLDLLVCWWMIADCTSVYISQFPQADHILHQIPVLHDDDEKNGEYITVLKHCQNIGPVAEQSTESSQTAVLVATSAGRVFWYDIGATSKATGEQTSILSQKMMWRAQIDDNRIIDIFTLNGFGMNCSTNVEIAIFVTSKKLLIYSFKTEEPMLCADFSFDETIIQATLLDFAYELDLKDQKNWTTKPESDQTQKPNDASEFIWTEGRVLIGRTIDGRCVSWNMPTFEKSPLTFGYIPSTKLQELLKLFSLEQSNEDIKNRWQIMRDGRLVVFPGSLSSTSLIPLFEVYSPFLESAEPLFPKFQSADAWQCPVRPIPQSVQAPSALQSFFKKAFTPEIQWSDDSKWLETSREFASFLSRDLSKQARPSSTNSQSNVRSSRNDSYTKSKLPDIDPDAPEIQDDADPIQRRLASASGGQSAFGNAAAGLLERQEKLGKLERKFADMADQSASFAEMAAEIRRREEAKKWYEF